MSSSAEARQLRRRHAHGLAGSQAGMLHRRQLYREGWTPEQVEAEIRAGRWQRTGWQTLATYTGPLPQSARWWWAVLETGPRSVIAGATALQAAGLTGLDEPTMHVAAPKSSRPRRTVGVHVHETRRLKPAMVTSSGLPRMKPVAAAVFAAMWAKTDRQAALFLVLPVQQRLIHPPGLLAAAAQLTRHPRASFIREVAHDLAGGARALGELDFAMLCRRAGLPEPDRQRLVHVSGSRYYLDVEWDDWQVVAEIDGVQHMRADLWVSDAWRQNDVVIGGRTVLRFPLLAIRLDPGRVVAQTRTALMSRGWRP